MTDDPRLAQLGQFTPEGILMPGYGDHYLFMVGRDDCHSILHTLFGRETMGHSFNAFGYDDEELNSDIMAQMKNPNIRVQGTLDSSQAGGVHERKILASDLSSDPEFYNSVAVGQSATHQISHTKGGVLIGQGIAYEGSMNLSNSGEGIGITLRIGATPVPGFKAQNNTLVITANPVFISRFTARLDAEHIVALQQQSARTVVHP
jgi:hypothetical protein